MGEYIAGAVLSIAFGLCVPAVDGNVRRVLSRVYGIDSPVNQRPAQQEIQTLARALTPEGAAGDFNQALMELGARICVPRRPPCAGCPIQESCLALAENRQNELPTITRSGPKPLREAAVGLISDASGRWLLVRRPAKGLLGGLWKWPGGERLNGEALEDALGRGVLAETGLEVKVLEEVGRVRHAFTHFRLTLFVYDCEWMGGPAGKASPTTRWCGLDEMAGLALSKVDRKILEFILNRRRG